MGTRVLLAEDEALIALNVQEMLDELGCVVVAAPTRVEEALAALEDPALRRYNHTEYPNPGQEISRDYVLGGLGKGRWVLIELVLHARSHEAQGYLLEMVGVQDASAHPEWLADYRGQKKARK